MISKLPDESNPKRAEAEEMAKAVTAEAYGGKLGLFLFSFWGSSSPAEINVLQLRKVARIRLAPNTCIMLRTYSFIQDHRCRSSILLGDGHASRHTVQGAGGD
jgi:hypothetical protein